VWAMVVKEFRQLRRDRRTLAMMVMVPLLLLVVFGYAASFDVDEIPTIVVGPQVQGVAGRLPELFHVIETVPGAGREEAVEALRDGEAVAAIFAGTTPEILLDGGQLFAARAAVTALARMPQAPEPTVLFNPELSTPVVMIPAIIGLILVFVGTVATSLGVVRERQAGTLEQLAVMPFRPRDVFVGKILPYLLVAAIDLGIILPAAMLLFDVPFRGSVLVFGLGALVFLTVTLGVGVLISTVSQNQGQAIQLAIMTLLPQVLLSGMMFPLDSMADGVRWIAYGLPLTYFVQISRGVMVRGAPLEAVALPILLLAALGLAVFGLAALRFRKDLAPAGRVPEETAS
jgi:ABC-2 type transport system permease protein